MNPDRTLWNERQQLLQRALSHPGDHPQAVELFLNQHAMVHSAAMSQGGLWSFEDEIWQGLTGEAARRIPKNGEHSIAWVIWHIARIEDVTMNLLVAGSPQVLSGDNWLDRMKMTIHHTGNAMQETEVADLSATIDLEVLRAYRVAVGRRTREIVTQLRPEEFEQKIQPSRIQQLRAGGDVLEGAGVIIDYWSKRTIAGLLLMPATRHNFLHLNEAGRIRQKRR